MAVSYDQGGHTVWLNGEISSQSDITLLEALEPREDPEQFPPLKTSRYPVSLEEYDRMVEEARKPSDETAQDARTAGERAVPPGEEERIGAAREFSEDLSEPATDAAPGILSTFEGITATGWYPPDPTIAVGKSQVLLSVNSDLAVYDKLGRFQSRWPNLKSFFKKVVPGNAKVFDPRLLYDAFNNRFIVMAAATRSSPNGAWLLVGISEGEDASGPYTVWASDTTLNNDTATNNWGDYPIAGYDEQALYVTLNMFEFNGSYQYSKLRIFNMSELAAGGTGNDHQITYWDIWSINDPDGRNAFSINPCIHYRTAGTNLPAYLMSAVWANSSHLVQWKLDSPLAGWSNGTPTLTAQDVPCLAYSLPPQAQQKGSSVLMATNDTRLLSAVYQNADSTQRIWAAHCSQVSWDGDTEARSCAQWYEIDMPTATVVQQNRFGASGIYYFFPALDVDQRRSAYMVMARSSATEYASIRETGRRKEYTAGEMAPSVQIRAGDGSYSVNASRQRWGDYFTAVRDGQDLYKVWVYGEFAAPNNQWSTWAASLRI
ncbi:hypothetical protein [Rhodobium gokarnense]|uniref:DUF946 domain-containing protein n=1 Tax=Rhodobium gokarnense TaxID=364296 RepID=A0ABT3HCF4_9HYPH|nr:hypothetical protein [Rhodobium gokarnense]MCW2308093.1 hypothetical protein [Rhodobium gokarnense]